MLYSKYGHSSAHDYVIMTTTSFLETATFCSLSIPDLLWQIFDRLLLNCRKMRETDTDCSYGKRKKGKVGRFCVIVAAIIFFQAMRTMLPCVLNSDFSPKLHCWQNGYLSFQESKSSNSWNGDEVRPKTRKWSSQGREKWVRIIKLTVFC